MNKAKNIPDVIYVKIESNYKLDQFEDENTWSDIDNKDRAVKRVSEKAVNEAVCDALDEVAAYIKDIKGFTFTGMVKIQGEIREDITDFISSIKPNNK